MRDLILKKLCDLKVLGTTPEAVVHKDGSISFNDRWINKESQEAYEKGKELMKVLTLDVLNEASKLLSSAGAERDAVHSFLDDFNSIIGPGSMPILTNRFLGKEIISQSKHPRSKKKRIIKKFRKKYSQTVKVPSNEVYVVNNETLFGAQQAIICHPDWFCRIAGS